MSLLTTAALQADGTILANWADGQSAAFGAYWLRDNCRCAQCRHPGNGQKLHQIVDLPAHGRLNGHNDEAQNSQGRNDVNQTIH